MYTCLNNSRKGYLTQQILYSACQCQICLDDAEPIKPEEKPRNSSTRQFSLSEAETLPFYFQKTLGFRGFFYISDFFFVNQNQLFYTNDYGRIKCKQKQANIDARKFFEEKRKKHKNSTTKEIAQLFYKDGTKNLLNEQHLAKIFQKRKNDPIWSEILGICLLPSTKENIQLCTFHFKRNQENEDYMRTVMEKVSKDIDAYEDQVNKDEGIKNASMIMMMSKSKFQSLFISARKMIEESIAYLEVANKIRVLESTFKYVYDQEGQPYIIEIKGFIAEELRKTDQVLSLHDRFQPLEARGEEELMKLKMKMDKESEEALWKLCISLTKECLEKRRVELKLGKVDSPSNEQLKKIFMKVFPDFSVQQTFANINWKNQIEVFIQDCKKYMKKLLNTDEGIRIMRRFGLQFYRTF